MGTTDTRASVDAQTNRGFAHRAYRERFPTRLFAVLGVVFLAYVVLSDSVLSTLVLTRPDAVPVVVMAATASAVPASLLAVYVWFSDPGERLSVTFLLAAFCLGAVVTVLAGRLNTTALGWFEALPFLGTVLFFFLVVGPVEEGLKILAVYLLPVDAWLETALQYAVVGAFVGLGFAFVENLIYVTSNAVFGWETAAGAAFGRSSVAPLHVVLTAVAGYYVGKARLNMASSGTGRNIVASAVGYATVVKAVAAVALAHATYNTLISGLASGSSVPVDGEVATVVVVVGFFLVIIYVLESRLREGIREHRGTG